MTAIPIAIYWWLALWGLFSARPVLVWLFFGILPFGSFAVVPTEVTGGVSLLGSTMTAVLIIAQQLFLRRSGPAAFLRLAIGRGGGMLLFLFWCVGIMVTLFAPRLFAGQIEVVPMALRSVGFLQTLPLEPTVQNFTQLSYMTVSIFAVFAFATVFRNSKMQPVLIRGVILSGMIVIITGLLDLLAESLSIQPLLEPFRTANYAILDNVRLVDGSKRVTGLMPEASSFGGLTMSLLACLYFLRRAITDLGLRRRANIVLAGLAVMLVLSTSSAGYVGIGVLLALIKLDWWVRAAGLARSPLVRRGVRSELFLALAGTALLIVVIMVMPATFDPVIRRLNDIVFTKTESLSYLERTFWTRITFEAGLSSQLIGVGLGSTRGSNFAAVIFGSTGLLGFLLYFGFVLRLMLRPAPAGDPQAAAIVSALKWSFFPVFIIDLLIGTTPDFGVFNALRWGVLLALIPAVAARRSPDWPKADSPVVSR